MPDLDDALLQILYHFGRLKHFWLLAAGEVDCVRGNVPRQRRRREWGRDALCGIGRNSAVGESFTDQPVVFGNAGFRAVGTPR